MDKEEYRNLLRSCYDLAIMANALDLGKLNEAVNMADRAEAIGPIVDPTLHKEKGKALSEDIKLLKLVRNFRSKVSLRIEADGPITLPA